jgi:hypothetical protein
LSELTRNNFNKENNYKMGKEEQVYAIAFMFAHCFSESYGQGLEAIVAKAKLPTALYSHAAVYDGIHSVYIFGG